MNIYYIGDVQADTAASFDANKADSFLEGSVTLYGSGKDGNVAYNSLNKVQLSDDFTKYEKRNEKIYSAFIAEQCHEIVKKDPKAVFIPYSYYFHSKIPQEYQDRVICANDPKVMIYLCNKFNFKSLINGKLQQAKFEYLTGLEVKQRMSNGTIPNEKEVVIQEPYGVSGGGTWIATKENINSAGFKRDIEEKVKDTDIYAVSDYIKNIGSISVHIQVSNNEIGIYPPGVQIMKGSAFSGTDLRAFTFLDKEAQQECIAAAKKFGEILKSIKEVTVGNETISDIDLRGYFGLDLIVAPQGQTPRVYAVETNARYTGSTSLLNILSIKAGVGSVFEHSFDAFYADKTNFGEKFAKIKPYARKRYAEVTKNEDGLLRSAEDKKRNREGLDDTTSQETDYSLYTHSVFEELNRYSFMDDAVNYKNYVMDFLKSQSKKTTSIISNTISSAQKYFDKPK